jgi:arsenate reductase
VLALGVLPNPLTRTKPLRIIFLCTANSCRSQMAEAWARRLCPADWEIQSAGLLTYPITEETRTAMAEVGLDMAGQVSKSLDRFVLDDFDLVVTLSRNSGRFLPQLSHPERHLHRPLPDPMQISGSDEKVLQAFRKARDRIRQVVEEILAKAQTPAKGRGRRS